MSHEAYKTALSYQGVSRLYRRNLLRFFLHLTAIFFSVYCDSSHTKTLDMTGSGLNPTDPPIGGKNGGFASLDLQDEDQKDFLIFYKEGIKSAILQIEAGIIQNKDLIILIIYSMHADWRTGRCRLTIARLSEMLGHKKETLYPSIRRLKNAAMLVPIRDGRTGEKLYIVNPFFMKAGSGKSRGYLIKTYADAIEANCSSPDEAEAFRLQVERASLNDPTFEEIEAELEG